MRLSSSTEWLFFHLWKKNPEMNNQSCPGVFIPDTIIYRWAKPFFWYFTTRDGQILRKTKERVFVENFEEIFQQNKNSGGLVAMSLTSQELMEKDGQVREKIEFEYFDKTGFKDYVYQREKTFGILQKFTEPKNGKNSLIKVSWSPQFCLLSRKTNIHDLNNGKAPLLDRVVTYEGAEYLSVSDSISSPILSSDVEQLCINIVKHIQDVSGGNIQISRMVLYFKLDDKNRLWLQFCTGIKVREKYVSNDRNDPILKSLQSPDERILSPMLKLSQKKMVDIRSTNILKKVNISDYNYVKSLKYENDNVCSNCSEPGELYPLKFMHIIDSFEHGIYDEESLIIQKKIKEQEEEEKNPLYLKEIERKKKEEKESLFYNLDEDEDDYYNKKFKNIPGILLKIWGKMTQEKYEQFKKNSSWLDMQTKVCDNCFIKLTQIMVDTQVERKAKTQQTKLKEQQKEEINQLFQLKSPEQIQKNKIKEQKLKVENARNTNQVVNLVKTPMNNKGQNSRKQSKQTDFQSKVQQQQQSSQQQLQNQSLEQSPRQSNTIQENQLQSQENDYGEEISQKQIILEQNQNQSQQDLSQEQNLNQNQDQNKQNRGRRQKSQNQSDILFQKLQTSDQNIQSERLAPINNSLAVQNYNIVPLTTRNNKKKNQKSKSIQTFNPAKVYNNKPEKLKLPNISNNSIISSGSTVHSVHASLSYHNQKSHRQKNDVNFMLSTIQDLKNVLNNEFGSNNIDNSDLQDPSIL